jgi:hypothetical protein
MNVPIKSVLYIEREHFQLSIETRADVVQYVYPPEFISNLDIIHPEHFKQNLTEFIKKNNLIFTNVLIVLSNTVVFEKDFKPEEQNKIQEYLDNVPFETIGLLKIPAPTGIKVIVANATFYTLLAEVFSQFGINIDYVIPESALGAPVGAFSAATARFILTRYAELVQYRFIIDTTTVNTIQPTLVTKEEPKKKDASLKLLLPVMGVILLILIFVIIQQFTGGSSGNKTAPTVLPTFTPVPVSPTTTSDNTNSTPAATAALKRISSVQILYDPSSEAKVNQLKQNFEPIGILNVQASSSSATVAVPVVVFAANIDQTDKQKVVEEVKKIFPDITVQDNPALTSDVSITIGKS